MVGLDMASYTEKVRSIGEPKRVITADGARSGIARTSRDW